jgi:hypothetical protein
MFYQFLEDVGQIQKGMETPTIGRKDHNKGYIFDTKSNRLNFAWQSMIDNKRESALRAAALGKTPLQTATKEQRSERGRKSAEHHNHVNKQEYTRYSCGLTGKGANMLRYHFDNCKRRYIHMIEYMKPIEHPQMMLSFGS